MVSGGACRWRRDQTLTTPDLPACLCNASFLRSDGTLVGRLSLLSLLGTCRAWGESLLAASALTL